MRRKRKEGKDNVPSVSEFTKSSIIKTNMYSLAGVPITHSEADLSEGAYIVGYTMSDGTTKSELVHIQ